MFLLYILSFTASNTDIVPVWRRYSSNLEYGSSITNTVQISKEAHRTLGKDRSQQTFLARRGTTHLCTCGELDNIERKAHLRVKTMTVGTIAPTCLRKKQITGHQLVLWHVVAPYHGAHRRALSFSSGVMIHSRQSNHCTNRCYSCLQARWLP